MAVTESRVVAEGLHDPAFSDAQPNKGKDSDTVAPLTSLVKDSFGKDLASRRTASPTLAAIHEPAAVADASKVACGLSRSSSAEPAKPASPVEARQARVSIQAAPQSCNVHTTCPASIVCAPAVCRPGSSAMGKSVAQLDKRGSAQLGFSSAPRLPMAVSVIDNHRAKVLGAAPKPVPNLQVPAKKTMPPISPPFPHRVLGPTKPVGNPTVIVPIESSIMRSALSTQLSKTQAAALFISNKPPLPPRPSAAVAPASHKPKATALSTKRSRSEVDAKPRCVLVPFDGLGDFDDTPKRGAAPAAFMTQDLGIERRAKLARVAGTPDIGSASVAAAALSAPRAVTIASAVTLPAGNSNTSSGAAPAVGAMPPVSQGTPKGLKQHVIQGLPQASGHRCNPHDNNGKDVEMEVAEGYEQEVLCGVEEDCAYTSSTGAPLGAKSWADHKPQGWTPPSPHPWWLQTARSCDGGRLAVV